MTDGGVSNRGPAVSLGGDIGMKEKVKITAGTAGDFLEWKDPNFREHLEARMRERDEREAEDTRTQAQRLLGEPPRTQSALAIRTPPDLQISMSGENAAMPRSAPPSRFKNKGSRQPVRRRPYAG